MTVFIIAALGVAFFGLLCWSFGYSCGWKQSKAYYDEARFEFEVKEVEQEEEV